MSVTEKDAEQPLHDEELKELLPNLEAFGPRTLVVAVSGGPDSMALMAAVARWKALAESAFHVVVATVNHGLRDEAKAECAMVAEEAARLGLQCRTLHWQGPKPTTGIQEKAREARYRLLFALCREENAFLLTAHTLDDVAETIMMRLARGSGISGLIGMEKMRSVDEGLLLRPLLAIAKARLIASCRAWNIPFVEDPSNQCEDFTRVRWRKLMPALAKEGLDARRIVIFADRLRHADKALADKTKRALKTYKIEDASSGSTRINGRALYEHEPLEIIWRVFKAMIESEKHFRLDRLEDCASAFRLAVLASTPLRRSLAGVIISLDKKGILTFSPEPPRKRGR